RSVRTGRACPWPRSGDPRRGLPRSVACEMTDEVVGEVLGVLRRAADVAGTPAAEQRGAQEVHPGRACDHTALVADGALVADDRDVQVRVVRPIAGRPQDGADAVADQVEPDAVRVVG